MLQNREKTDKDFLEEMTGLSFDGQCETSKTPEPFYATNDPGNNEEKTLICLAREQSKEAKERVDKLKREYGIPVKEA